ncbi:hypothetical protein PM082_022870 [Marasmius tenuissimus]|nr:hypothetical protein PM082_022870 [Marasmius tenuissimus]
MTEISLLSNASNVQIGNRAMVQTAGRDQINVYNDSRTDPPWVTLSGNTYRKIPMGDIIVTRDVSSKILEATIQPRRKISTAGESQQSIFKVIKVKMTTQHVEVLTLPGKFTSIMVEAMEEDQTGELKAIVDCVCSELSSRRSPLFPQLVGLGWSERPVFIVYDELANGDDYIYQVLTEGKWIVFYYLWYTKNTSFNALDDNNTLSIPVSSEWSLWTFNPRTHAWQYNVSSAAISPPDDDTSLAPFHYGGSPLRQDTRPQLDVDEIVACFEDQLGDFLHVIASFGKTRHVENLSDFARHGYLTFGTVVNRTKPEILAYLPSSPSLDWYCWNYTANIQASYSSTVPSRVDLSFQNTDYNRIDLHFSLHYPKALQHHPAYLSQSVPLFIDCDDPLDDLVFIDDIRFSLVGTFHHNPATSSILVYLFVPLIPLEKVNNLSCIRYPLLHPSFYWSLDPNGHSVICEDDWAAYGIPCLEFHTWIEKEMPTRRKEICASIWVPRVDHGDPHNPRINVIEELHEGQNSDSFAELLDAEAVASSGQEPDNFVNDDTPTNIKHTLDQALEVVGHHENEAAPIQDVAKGPKEHVLHKTAPIPGSSGEESKSHRPVMRKASNRIRAFHSTLANHCQRIFVGIRRSKKGGGTHQPSEEGH